MRGAPIAAALAAVALASSASAATLAINVTDPSGSGFLDQGSPDAASSAGGNDGTTLGEQRPLAFQFAADIWGELLQSQVTIQVDASMANLECTSASAVLGSAAPTFFYWNPDDEKWYPAPLADALNEADLDPGLGDIEAIFNARVDQPNCLGNSRWYYGLDGQPPSDGIDFVSVVLHELAHGLGVIALLDLDTGVFLGDGENPDVFGSLVFDNSAGQYWTEMSNGQRAQSVQRTRSIVWDGPAVSAAAAEYLATGSPQVVVTPNVPAFRGALSETNFGPTVLTHSAEGPLVVVDDSCSVPSQLQGAVVLMRFTGCLGVDEAADAGAVGVLLDTGKTDLPPGDLNLIGGAQTDIVALHLASGDAAALSTAADTQTLSVAITASSSLVGADDQGRLLLNATSPVDQGSSISHWDSLARRTPTLDAVNRDLLMEPASETVGSEVDLTVHMLRDMGWGAAVCGDGNLDAAEQCDEGADNSNTEPDACRSNCQLPRCGDDVADQGEECDLGANNADGVSSRCRLDCSLPPCGNARIDEGEACDDGNANSDTTKDSCRTNCTAPSCGDAVADTGEQCDLGSLNGTLGADCLSGCVRPACGDGAVSGAEECDDGANNSNLLPGACRRDCRLPRCGDGVVDPGEWCDDGVGNGAASAQCRADCTLPRCGDGVVDGLEECDEGALNSDSLPNACRTTCVFARCGDGTLDAGEQCDDGNVSALDECDGSCRLPLGGPPSMMPPTGPAAAEPSPTSPSADPTVDATGDPSSPSDGPEPVPHDGADAGLPSAPLSGDAAAPGPDQDPNATPNPELGAERTGCSCDVVGLPAPATKGWALVLIGAGLLLYRRR